jgi:Fe-S-cluster containining protein
MSLATLPTIKMTRENLPEGKGLCDYCTAKCCKYFALPIDTPTERQDYDFIRWFLLHEHATVFTEDGTWYILVHTTCKHLRADNLCGIYETRPQICRDYTTDNCEYDDDWVYDQYFETAEQVAEYTEAILGHADGLFRSPKPALLPLL